METVQAFLSAYSLNQCKNLQILHFVAQFSFLLLEQYFLLMYFYVITTILCISIVISNFNL